MSAQRSTILLPVLLALAVPVAAVGQRAPGNPAGARIYDPTTVRTVEGGVTDVLRIPKGGRHDGVHLTLVVAEKPIDVHLGPEWFVDPRLPNLAKGDRVEVTGSEVVVDGQPALVAQAVRRGDARVTLRDEAGKPLWSGGRRR